MVTNSARLARATIAVVDDEPAIRDMERRILERAGYRVVEAAGGREGIALLQDHWPIDLLIADLDMPETPGEEMVRQIRAARADLKVLYVTGNIDRLFAIRSMLWDGEAFLDKPFTAMGLLQAVSLLLDGTLSDVLGTS